MFYSFRCKITNQIPISPKGHENLDELQVMLGRSLDTAGSCGAYHVVLQMGLLLWPQFDGVGVGFDTPLKFNMEPEKKSLEKVIPFGNHHFQVPC